MGAFTSRQNAAVEEADVTANHAYRYPPRAGNYFGCHFIMGGERFDTPQPEAYLFGENADLNFLGSRPAPFPYPPPQANELTKTLKSLVNIRKESVRLVKIPDIPSKIKSDDNGNSSNSFNIEFTFDADAKCAITLYYFATEEIGSNGINYLPRDSAFTSETFHYDRGVNQLFSQPSHTFNPQLFPEEDLGYNSEKDILPIAIHCVVEEARQTHTTICVVDHHPDGVYAIRALKQKIYVDGLCYLLQEIYGIENKNITRVSADEDTEDNGSECVICMCDTRDTLILPCRHLCLCNSCADSLRYQANNCPICRAPFRALLQIRAVQKSSNSNVNSALQPSGQDANGANDNIPDGYVAVALVEALNGPLAYVRTTVANNSDGEDCNAVQAAELLNRNNEKTGKQSSKDSHKNIKDKINSNNSDFRMSVLLSKEDGTVTKELLTKHSPLMNRAPVSRDKNPREKGNIRHQGVRDCVKMVNEKNLIDSSQNNENLENDDDSDTEKLSPLLNSKMILSPNKDILTTSALHLDGVVDSIDDLDADENRTRLTNTEKNDRPDSEFKLNLIKDADNIIILAGAEDSDYYTPEDPHSTILNQIYSEEKNSVKKDNQKTHISSSLAAIKEYATSLPDSPISGGSASSRSSGDSYSSSSSTRQLLETIVINDLNKPQEKIMFNENDKDKLCKSESSVIVNV